MVKNLIIYIFIYTLLVGCDGESVSKIMTNSVCESDCFLEIEAPDLQIDNNGYYHIEWLEGYTQTFTTLDAKTGSDNYHRVSWYSDSGVTYQEEFISCVNPASYTNENDGIAHTVLSVWESMIGDTLIIQAGYTDDCDNWFRKEIKVVVNNEI